MKLHFSEKKEGQVHYLYMEGDLIGDEVGLRIAGLVSDSVEEGIKTVVIDLEKVRENALFESNTRRDFKIPHIEEEHGQKNKRPIQHKKHRNNLVLGRLGRKY